MEPLDPVDTIAGIGPTAKKALAEHGIRTVADLAWVAPVGWDDFRAPVSLREAVATPGRHVFAAVVVSASMMPLGRRRGVRVVLRDRDDEACKLHAFWFFMAHGILTLAKPGAALLVLGKVVVEPKKPPRTAHPEMFLDGPDARVVRPRYPRLGPKGAVLRKAVAVAATVEADPVPADVALREGMPAASALVRSVHGLAGELPTPEDRRGFIERLAWAEAFTKAWERLDAEATAAGKKAAALPPVPRVVAKLEKALGFAFTRDQRAAIAEVGADLATDRPMRRLLLGDVGTGKTAVALAAVAQAVAAGKQAAILAPTTVLAEQYMLAVRPLLKVTSATAVLITGEGSKRNASRASVNGSADPTESEIAIGTHALLGSGVTFSDLALVVVDEQQRLGVGQRLALVHKGRRPHLLSLSATPIPRTMALALRGELATTTLKERPAGREPVATSLVPRSKLAEVVRRAEDATLRGERVFWVVPRIEETGEDDDEPNELASLEARVQALRLEVKGIGTIHGRMKPEEKRAAMEAFRSGETRLLVGTTVIEVGVDVPEATLMVIEGAEQFGLAQLHQLRGRVGRGAKPGACVLLHDEPLEGLARRRLEQLAALTSGDDVAKADLELRGAGDLGGTRQHGDEEAFVYLDPAEPWPWLARIEADARALRAADPKLARPEHEVLGALVARLRRALAVREEAG